MPRTVCSNSLGTACSLDIFIQDIRSSYQSIHHMLTIKEYLNLIGAGHFQTLQSMTSKLTGFAFLLMSVYNQKTKVKC